MRKLLIAAGFLLAVSLTALAAERPQRPGGGRRPQGGPGRQAPGGARRGPDTTRPQQPGGAQRRPGISRPGGQRPGTPRGPAGPTRPQQGPRRPPQQKPKGGQKEPEGEEEEEEGGTVLVLPDNDAVVLRDGTRIEGTILCAGAVAVTILTPEGEKTIPREKVERIVKNADAKSPEEHIPEELDGHKYLMGTGGVVALTPPKKDEGPEIVPRPKPQPAPPQAAPPQPKPAQPPAKARPAPAKPKPPVAKPPKALPKVQVPSDPEQLRALLRKLREEGTLGDYLRDPEFRKALRDAVRKQQRQKKNKPE